MQNYVNLSQEVRLRARTVVSSSMSEQSLANVLYIWCELQCRTILPKNQFVTGYSVAVLLLSRDRYTHTHCSANSECNDRAQTARDFSY